MAKDPQDSSTDSANIDALPKALRDSIDLNNEYAGRETGRIKRFLTAQDESGPGSEKEKEKRHISRLMQLLQDPIYSKAYFEVEAILERAESATAIALARNADQLHEASEYRETLRDAAADAPDGRKIFASNDGNVYYEDGTKVEDPAVRSLAHGSPSWEEYQRAQRMIERLERERHEIEEYQRSVVGPSRTRLEDQDNPPSRDELEEIRKRLETRMPQPVRDAYDESSGPGSVSPVAGNEAADDYLNAPALNAPDLPGHFKAAHDAASLDIASSPLPGRLPKATA